ncbi:MAG: hypothetical protein ACOZF0_20630 [Thermodesulfobacteriota bacterium]
MDVQKWIAGFDRIFFVRGAGDIVNPQGKFWPAVFPLSETNPLIFRGISFSMRDTDASLSKPGKIRSPGRHPEEQKRECPAAGQEPSSDHSFIALIIL